MSQPTSLDDAAVRSSRDNDRAPNPRNLEELAKSLSRASPIASAVALAESELPIFRI